jgi:Uma2 family endonuclease
MPELKKAELIDGIVYFGPSVRFEQHGEPHLRMGGWLGCYQAKTCGVSGGSNSTVRLDDDNEPQPDLLLRIDPAAGGKSRIDEDGYLNGPVELAIEIAASSVSIDTHIKMEAYRKMGIGEYLVYRVLDQAVNWYRLEDSKYVEIPPDAAGIIRSQVFPGLWLSPGELLAGNLAGLFAVIDRGVATAEHQAFCRHLAAAR